MSNFVKMPKRSSKPYELKKIDPKKYKGVKKCSTLY
jgi:hypothetical protein